MNDLLKDKIEKLQPLPAKSHALEGARGYPIEQNSQKSAISLPSSFIKHLNKRLFAIGDIHGCFDSLKELVENKIKLQKNDKLILLLLLT